MVRVRSHGVVNWFYVLPALILIACFVYYPLIANLVYSFFAFSAGAGAMTPVGLDNIVRVINDPIIHTALINNVVYAVVSIICQVGGGLVIAAWLTSLMGKRMGAFLRSV